MTIFSYPLIAIVRTYNGARRYREIISPGIICGSKLMNIFYRVQFPDFQWAILRVWYETCLPETSIRDAFLFRTNRI